VPFDQIYWNNYGQGDVAESGYFDKSESLDVRFGVTATADSHSTFSFFGKRRKFYSTFYDLTYRDTKFPFNANNMGAYGRGGFWKTSPTSAEPDPALPQSTGNEDGNCDKSKGWTDSGYDAGNGQICKPLREYQVQVQSTVCYSWPGIEEQTYSSFNVNDMKKTGNNGNNIVAVYGDSPTDDDLFQAQNRESCHNISNTARVIDADHPFIGIHADYPLTVTTKKAMQGYYVILKRKRFVYNEYASKHTEQYGSYGSAQFQKGGNIKPCHVDTRQGHYLHYDEAGDLVDYPKQSTDQEEMCDHIVRVRTSALGQPFSTTRDYVDVYPGWGGYNFRAAGGLSGRTEAEDLKGLFRSRVPYKGWFVLPWDNLDTAVNTWYSEWNELIVAKLLAQSILQGQIDIVTPLQQAFNDANTAANDAYAVYSNLYDEAEDLKETYDNKVTAANTATTNYNTQVAIAESAGATAEEETTKLNTLNTQFNSKNAEYETAVSDYNDAVTAQSDAVDAYNAAYTTLEGWYNYCWAWAGDNHPLNTNIQASEVDWDSFDLLCGETDSGNQYWGDGYFASYNAAWNAWVAADQTLNQANAAEDTALATRNTLQAEVEDLDSQVSAQTTIQEAAVAASTAADAEATRLQGIMDDKKDEAASAKTAYDNKVIEVNAAWDVYEPLDTERDNAQTTLSTAQALQILAQDVYDDAALAESAYPDNAGNALKDRIQNPVYYADDRLNWRMPKWDEDDGGIDMDRADPDGENHDGSVNLIDAVISPEFVPRERAETGSVYIKSITVKKNGTGVLQPGYDAVGRYIELPSNEIYTDQSSKINASGSSGQKIVTFKNMFRNGSSYLTRYISNEFLISFSGSTKKYSIDSVSGNKITLTENLSTSLNNSTFTLHIPRGAREKEEYTWGNYDLSEFDSDTYETLVDLNQKHQWPDEDGNAIDMPEELIEDDMISRDHAGYVSDELQYQHALHVINDSTTWLIRDLFLATSANTNDNTLNLIYAADGLGMGEGHLGKAVRHPYFANELGESLNIRNDFFNWAYHEYLYFSAPAGQGGHCSCKVGGNVTWNKYRWIKWWEMPRTNAILEDDAAVHYNNSGFSNLRQSVFDGFVSYTDLYGIQIDTKAKQFFYGGVDKASSAIWPCYENNIPQTSPEAFDQKFSTHYPSWGVEFEEAYTNYNHSLRGVDLGADANNTPTIQRVLDRPWFTYCAFSQCPGLKTNMYDFQGNSNQRLMQQFAMSHRDYTETSHSQRAIPWKALQKSKYEKILKRPSVLAQYGFAGDMFGYTTADVGFANNTWADHNITVYESNNYLPQGSHFEISLHQAGTEFNDDIRDEWERRIPEENLIGDGRSKISLDNYTAYIVAK
jgi:hypothetical protein